MVRLKLHLKSTESNDMGDKVIEKNTKCWKICL